MVAGVGAGAGGRALIRDSPVAGLGRRDGGRVQGRLGPWRRGDVARDHYAADDRGVLLQLNGSIMA